MPHKPHHPHPSGGSPPALAARPADGELPTPEDAAFLAANPARSTAVKPQPYEVSFLFTPNVIDAMKSPAVTAFFGESLNLDTLEDDAARASTAAAVHDRLENGLEAVSLLHAPPAKALTDRVSLMMDRWEAFSAAHPAEARALTAFKTYWATIHRGGRRTNGDSAAKNAADGTNDAATGTKK